MADYYGGENVPFTQFNITGNNTNLDFDIWLWKDDEGGAGHSVKVFYDVSDHSNYPSMYFDKQCVFGIAIKNKNRSLLNHVYIHSIQLYLAVNGNSYTRMRVLWDNFINDKKGKYKVNRQESVLRIYHPGKRTELNPLKRELTNTDNKDRSELKYTGSVGFYAYVKWENAQGKIRYDWFHLPLVFLDANFEEVTGARPQVKSKEFETIVLGNTPKTEFYKGEKLTFGGTVNAIYRYPGCGKEFVVEDISNYTISPSLGSTLGGSQSVYITYRTDYTVKVITYNINVYGVKGEPTHPTWNIGSIPPGTVIPSELTEKCHIEYEDGTSEDVTVYVSAGDGVTQRTLYFEATSTKTFETDSNGVYGHQKFTWSRSYNTSSIRKIELRLTDNVKTSYNYNESINTSGVTVVGYYGYTDSYGNVHYTGQYTTIPISNCSVSTYYSWGVGENMVKIVYQNCQAVGYDIYINGLLSLDVNIENCPSYDPETGNFKIVAGEPLVTTGKTAQVQRWYNGETQPFDTWSGTISDNISSLDLTKPGEKTVKFSVIENGQRIYDEKIVNVVVIESVTLKSIQDKLLIYEGNTVALSVGNLKVVQTNSDGSTKTLTLNAAVDGYTVTPAIGTPLTEGNYTITIETTTGLTAQYNLTVIKYAPLADCTLTIKGTLSKYVYSRGQTIELDGIEVFASEMTDGSKNVKVPFKATIDGLTNSLVIPNNLEDGWNDLVITVEGCENEALDSNGNRIQFLIDYVSSVTDLSCSRVYKSGEVFDKNSVSGTINFAGGTSRDLVPADITTEVGDIHYGEDETLTLTIAGIEKTLNVTIIKVNSLMILPVGGMTEINYAFNYKYGDAFDRTRYNATKTYTNGTRESVDMADIEFDENLDETSLESTTSSPTVAATLSYTEDNFTVTTNLSLNVQRLKSIQLLGPDPEDNTNTIEISKIILNYGDVINLQDYILKITYNDSILPTYIYNNNIVLTKNGANIVGNKIYDAITGATASASCGTETLTTSVDFHIVYLSDLDVTFTGLDNLYEFDLLDLSDITATKTYKCTDPESDIYEDGETTDCTDDLNFKFNTQNIEVTGFKLPTAGTYQLVAEYNDGRQKLSESTNIVVNQQQLQSISVSTSNTFKPLDSYIYHEYLDLSGLTISLVYNKTSVNRTISYTDPSVEIIDENGDSVSKTQLLDYTYDGVEIYVKYTENGITKYASIGTLAVALLELTGIEIVQNPKKMTYTYGDVFSLEGMIVKASFNNGTSELINIQDLDLTGSDVAIGHAFNPTEDGTSYGNLTFVCSYTHGGITESTSTFVDNARIVFAAPNLDHLETNAYDLSGPVRLTFKNNNVYNDGGLIVTAVMENGWKVELASFLTNASSVLNIDANGRINVDDYGSYVITVTGTNPYNLSQTKTTTYQIEVSSSGAVSSAILLLSGDYNQYFVGDTFTAKGVSFQVTDIDGETWVANPSTTKPGVGSILRKAQRIEVEVTYTNGSFSKTEYFDIIVSVPNSLDVVETNNYQMAFGKLDGSLFTTISHEEAEIKLGKVLDDNGNLIGEFYPLFHEDKISVDDNPAHLNTLGYNIYTGTDAVHDCVGYIDLGSTDIRNAHVVLFDDPINPIEGDSNIEVLFPHYTQGNADKINKCKFGIVYNNRLFVSGNEDYQNIDFHSSETNNEINEFTYFSDLDYCKYGSDSNAVVGYSIYRDGDLLVFKEGSKREATIFRRETKVVEATDYQGNTVEGLEELYPCYPVNNSGGTGAISSKAICNFFGETLVVTDEGVKAVTNKDNVYSNAKYTFDVSTAINPRIKNESVDYSFIYPFQECAFLRTNRGVYVAYHDIRNENNEYEWYFTDIKADLFFELDKQLYFANNDGGIYRFNKNRQVFVDKPRIFVGAGGTTLSIDESNNKIIVNGAYESDIKEGNTFHVIADLDNFEQLPTTQIHASLGLYINKNTRANMVGTIGFDQTLYTGILDSTNNTIKVETYTSSGEIDKTRTAREKKHLYNGLPVYIDNITAHGDGLMVNKLYYLQTDSALDDTYNIVDEMGEVINLTGVEIIRLSYNIGENKITKIHNVSNYLDTNGKQFELIGDHNDVLDLIYYNNKDDCQYKGAITTPKNIEAYYLTVPYVLGSALHMKTIWSVAVTNDTGMASEMDIAYLSSHKQTDYGISVATSSGSKQWNLDEPFKFETVQFVNDGLPHTYQRYKVIPRVGFIRFLMRNNEKSNLIVSSLSVIYSISQFTKGER